MTHTVTSNITGKTLFTGDADECLSYIAQMLQDEGYEERDLELEEQDEHPTCGACNGSGEGMYDGSRCHSCHGRGTE